MLVTMLVFIKGRFPVFLIFFRS